ncbi:MAG: hypothetical protein KKB04_04330 [Candidatus Thermoplasmatota archaeon]|nr:hypothetical protein [Candidatus Thermoplasmatota archaeon]
MALKDVLEDKKKKRTITIVGTIVIILVTAGVFSYEASSIEVKEPVKDEVTTEEGTTTTVQSTVNETGDYNYEADKTVKGSCRNPDTVTAQAWGLYDDTQFPIRSGAKKAVITVSADVDIDLRIYYNGERVDNGAGVTAGTTEKIELPRDLKEGKQLSGGDWTARVNRYSLFSNPAGETEYHITIHVDYE